MKLLNSIFEKKASKAFVYTLNALINISQTIYIPNVKGKNMKIAGIIFEKMYGSRLIIVIMLTYYKMFALYLSMVLSCYFSFILNNFNFWINLFSINLYINVLVSYAIFIIPLYNSELYTLLFFVLSEFLLRFFSIGITGFITKFTSIYYLRRIKAIRFLKFKLLTIGIDDNNYSAGN